MSAEGELTTFIFAAIETTVLPFVNLTNCSGGSLTPDGRA